MRAESRAPRVRVLANGTVLDGVIGAEVSANNHLAADRFHVQLVNRAGVLGAVDAPGVRIEVHAGFDGGWTTLVVGEADSVVLDPLHGVLAVEGRDLSALLIDTRVDETFVNQTSSEVVETVAGRHGLDVAAQRTGTAVGRYYQSEHGKLTLGQSARTQSEWDLLSALAAQEGFDLFMDGATLRFEAAGGGGEVPLAVEDCVSLRLEHALGMERQIEVTVRSWDQLGAAAVVQTAKGGGRGRSLKRGVVKPNLPADEAQRLAERVLADLLRHARTIEVTMPGEVGITPRSRVALQGTGTDWDRVYSVSDIRRQIDVRHGFTQLVRLQGLG